MRRIGLLVILLLFSCQLSAGEEPIKPIRFPMSFSGTYGELRHDHFHSGVDWITGGKVGESVYAIKSGYISKITVSTRGYGRAIFITHPDNTISVYGHLLCFTKNIEELVKEKQYKEKSFSVTIIPQKEELSVSKGEMIAKSGNSGSSGGPHLHLEVRDEKSGIPINYISRGYYSVKDNLSPVFHEINFYSFSNSAVIPVTGLIKRLSWPTQNNILIYLPQKSYVGIDAFDRQEGTRAKLAVEEYKVYLDNELIFGFKINDIPNSYGRYIKSLIEYEESYIGGADVIKTYVEPGNALSSLIQSKNNGIIVLNDYNEHKVGIEVIDEHGNKSVLNYRVKRKDIGNAEHIAGTPVLWYLPGIFINKEVSFAMPAASLYRSIFFIEEKVSGPDKAKNIYSPMWKFGDIKVPLHENAYLKFFTEIPERLKKKTLIARYNGEKLIPVHGSGWDSNGVVAKVGFGTYCVAVDTIAPTIKFYFKSGARIDRDGVFKIEIKDDFSGVQYTDVEVDGKWVLFEPKNGMIVVRLDRERVKKGKNKIKVTVRDYCGNESVSTINFIW
ncbi:MAG: M23 family metallopeptidase [Bacteroidales bacterium]